MSKRVLVIILFLLIYNTCMSCDMAAAISKDGNFWFNGYPSSHFCTKLNEKINTCDETCGRNLIFYDEEQSDGIFHQRVGHNEDLFLYGTPSNPGYASSIENSTIMLSHARLGTTGGSEPYHPFVWEARDNGRTYTFMANGTLEIR